MSRMILTMGVVSLNSALFLGFGEERVMPTYDYQCTDCGHEFEAFHSISAAPLTACPECEGAVQRLIGTGAGFLFKGAGFYQTDYRSSEYSKAAAADKPKEKAEKPAGKKDEKSASNKGAKKAQ